MEFSFQPVIACSVKVPSSSLNLFFRIMKNYGLLNQGTQPACQIHDSETKNKVYLTVGSWQFFIVILQILSTRSFVLIYFIPIRRWCPASYVAFRVTEVSVGNTVLYLKIICAYGRSKYAVLAQDSQNSSERLERNSKAWLKSVGLLCQRLF